MTDSNNQEIKLKLFLDYIQGQTGMETQDIAEEMAAALQSVIIKNKLYPENAQIQVQIDPNSGLLEIFREWTIVDNDKTPLEDHTELPLDLALSITDEAAVGENLLESLPADNLGRIAAQQAKQLFSKIIREGQIAQKRKFYDDKIGDIITGTVKSIKRDFILIETSDQSTGIMYKKNTIAKETFRENDKIKAVIVSNHAEYRNAVIEVSRTHPDFMKQLFLSEVPEIHEGSIEIMGIARDPGSRAKMAVKSNDRRVDPIGACIGMRGTRVQAVTNELNGERVDMLLWDKDPVKLIIQALAPGKVESIEINEETQTMELNVSNENLAQLIGRSGQNIKLASDLTGWRLDIKKQQHSDEQMIDNLCRLLDVDKEIASLLVKAHLTTPQLIVQSNAEHMQTQIPEFDEDIADSLIDRARDALLEQALENDNIESDYPLLEHEHINIQFAEILKENDIVTNDDLAELSTDELMEIIPLDSNKASELIMKARAHWFED